MTNARKARLRRQAAIMRNQATIVQGMEETYSHPGGPALKRRQEAHDKPGEHLWIMTGAWRVDDPVKVCEAANTPEFDPEKAVLLDAENMIAFAGPGCFKCEEEYSPELARRPCTGSVTDLM